MNGHPNHQQWPYTEPHVGYTRYGAKLASGLVLKGLDLDDAIQMVMEEDAVDVVHQYVVYITGGHDEGTEILGPWRPARTTVRSGQ